MNDTTKTPDVTKTAMLVAHRVHRWSGYKFDRDVTRQATETANASESAGRFNKHLIDRKNESYRAIDKLLNDARAHHYANTLPFDDRGQRILTVANFEPYTREQDRMVEELRTLKPAFVGVYAQLVDEQRDRLGDMFDEDDYPPPLEIASRFSLAYSIRPFPDPDHFLIKLGRETDERIAARLREDTQRSIQEATRDLWSKLAEAVGNVAERLELNEDGTPKRFHNSLIGNLRELVELLPRLNLTGDADLESMRQRVSAQLCQHDAATLKPNAKTFDADARRDTKAAADQILAAMSAYTGGAS